MAAMKKKGLGEALEIDLGGPASADEEAEHQDAEMSGFDAAADEVYEACRDGDRKGLRDALRSAVEAILAERE